MVADGLLHRGEGDVRTQEEGQVRGCLAVWGISYRMLISTSVTSGMCWSMLVYVW